MEPSIENVFEFLKTDETVTATLSKKKWVNRVNKLCKEFPDIFIKTVENSDGSIVVRFPLRYLRISSPRKYNSESNISDEWLDKED